MSATAGPGQASFCVLHGSPAGLIEARWRTFLSACDVATHYVAPEYFLEPGLRGKKPFALLSLEGEQITGILTGIHDGDRVQSGLSVRPQVALLRAADRARAMSNLVAGLGREAQSATLVDVYGWLGTADALDARFCTRRYEGVVMLDLRRGPQALFARFSENKRTNIKKAVKLGVSVDVAEDPEDIAAYHAVYVQWSRRKALPTVAEDVFQETFALTANRRLFLARHAGHVIAGVVVRFCPGGMMEYAANSSRESALHLRPNDLLHWRAIEWGCAEGLSNYSLGGAHLFLRKFGGEVIPTIRHRLDRSPFRRHTLSDWVADRAQSARRCVPRPVVAIGRKLRSRLERLCGA